MFISNSNFLSDSNSTNDTRISSDLFPRIAAGEKEAFYQLYQRTAKSVYAFLLSILYHKEDPSAPMKPNRPDPKPEDPNQNRPNDHIS